MLQFTFSSWEGWLILSEEHGGITLGGHCQKDTAMCSIGNVACSACRCTTSPFSIGYPCSNDVP